MIDIKLKNFQEDTVDFLFSKTTDSNSKPKIVMESPTGSGKTIILVAYIEKYLDFHKDSVICWFCPGNGELEEQSKKNGTLCANIKNRECVRYFKYWF